MLLVIGSRTPRLQHEVSIAFLDENRRWLPWLDRKMAKDCSVRKTLELLRPVADCHSLQGVFQGHFDWEQPYLCE